MDTFEANDILRQKVREALGEFKAGKWTSRRQLHT